MICLDSIGICVNEYFISFVVLLVMLGMTALMFRGGNTKIKRRSEKGGEHYSLSMRQAYHLVQGHNGAASTDQNDWRRKGNTGEVDLQLNDFMDAKMAETLLNRQGELSRMGIQLNFDGKDLQ